MKKVEIAVGAILLVSLGLYIIPNLSESPAKKNATIKTNCAVFTSNILAQFSEDKTIKASVAAQKAIEELNKSNKNPVKKNKQAFYMNERCSGCVTVETDDKSGIVTLEGLDANLKIIQKTTIKPPSFVVYEK